MTSITAGASITAATSITAGATSITAAATSITAAATSITAAATSITAAATSITTINDVAEGSRAFQETSRLAASRTLYGPSAFERRTGLDLPI